jgi:hypothetical protein
MTTDLTPTERDLFERLVIAAGELATTAELAGSVLSEEHEDMCSPYIDNVRHILEQIPTPESGVVWNGELRDADLKVTTFHVRQGPDGKMSPDPIGVKILHLPTGIGRESSSKRTEKENREVVKRALQKAVDKEYSSRG